MITLKVNAFGLNDNSAVSLAIIMNAYTRHEEQPLLAFARHSRAQCHDIKIRHGYSARPKSFDEKIRGFISNVC